MSLSAERQLERRRKILANTLDMIREVGHDNLNVRELAKHCGVSVPTLYNQFESKEKLIVAVAEEIYGSYLKETEEACQLRGLDRLIYCVDSVGDLVENNPRICRMLVKATPKKSDTLKAALRFYTRPIVEMLYKNQLVDWIEPDDIGKRIFARIRNILVDWTEGTIADDEVTPARRIDVYFLLLGISKGPTQKRIQSLLRKELLDAKNRKKSRRPA